MGEAGQGTVLDHFTLEDHFPHELADSGRDRFKRESGLGTRLADDAHDWPKAPPEQPSRSNHQEKQEYGFDNRGVTHRFHFDSNTGCQAGEYLPLSK